MTEKKPSNMPRPPSPPPGHRIGEDAAIQKSFTTGHLRDKLTKPKPGGGNGK